MVAKVGVSLTYKAGIMSRELDTDGLTSIVGAETKKAEIPEPHMHSLSLTCTHAKRIGILY